MDPGALNMFPYSNDDQETWYKNAAGIVRKIRMKHVPTHRHTTKESGGYQNWRRHEYQEY